MATTQNNAISILLKLCVICLLPAGADAQEKWLTFQPAGAGVAFEMPTNPRVNQKEFVSPDKKSKIVIHLFNSVTEDKQKSLVMSYYDAPQSLLTPKEKNDFLNSAANGTINKLLGSTLKNEAARFKNRYPARDLIYLNIYQGMVHKIQTRFILVDDRLYNLSVVAPQDEFDSRMAKRFLDSFQIVNDSFDLPPKPRRRK